MKRLAILSTHPIQYNAPLYRLLAADPQTEVMVFFSKATEATRFDPDFGQEIIWDVPLTDGYSCVTIPSGTIFVDIKTLSQMSAVEIVIDVGRGL